MAKTGPTENRYALCIGINQAGTLSPLKFAENDAEALHALLLQKGFAAENCKLLLGADATTQNINIALKEFIGGKPKRNDLVLFYFAGHSEPLEGEDEETDIYLATADYDPQLIESDDAFRSYDAFGLARLRRDFFERSKSNKILFIFDSCYSGDFPGKNFRGPNPAQGYVQQLMGEMSAGKVALSSCLPHQTSSEPTKLGHGLFTYHLLQALRGEAEKEIYPYGELTVGSLFKHLSRNLPKEQIPVLTGTQHGDFVLLDFPEKSEAANQSGSSVRGTASIDKATRIRAMFSDHSGFMRDRLGSFVGRTTELAEIQQQITAKLPTGGYITITGQAGQGKSSVIAKLVQQHIQQATDDSKIAYHFIPFNPGPDHQVNLLRNLMARLILKYDLTDLYVASESRPALRDFFPKVLSELVAKGGQEVIFIDGLDQLEEEQSGTRDLSFLPDKSHLPENVVFVLGTRPNDTLRPLELLKPQSEYKLPNLSRADFDLILSHRQVTLERGLAGRFYEAMQQNALYLDLVAKELHEAGTETTPEELVRRIADNPDNLFSLSLTRLKRNASQWREILKPVLGLLLAAREPLGIRPLRQLIGVDDNELRDGLQKLGGLVASDGEGRRYLYHLKLQEFLRQDETKPTKEYIFASDEEESYHLKLARWCEGCKGGLSTIWQDLKSDGLEQSRREYARQHYITHLYRAKAYATLFEVLDEGSYGRGKLRYDPSTRSYAQDLDLGREAAALGSWSFEEGLSLLPELWRYSLLRSTLASQADNYPIEWYEGMVLVGCQQEAIGLVELLTDSKKKADVLRRIGLILWQGGKERSKQEALVLLGRALEVARNIKGNYFREEALIRIAKALGMAGEYEATQELAYQIEDNYESTLVLVEAKAKADGYEVLQELARNIENTSNRAVILGVIAEAMVRAGEYEAAQELAYQIEDSYLRGIVLIGLAQTLIMVGEVERASYLLREVQELARNIEGRYYRALALIGLAQTLIMAGEVERALYLLRKIQEVAQNIKDSRRSDILRGVVEAMVKAGEYEAAQELAYQIEDNYRRALALIGLAQTLIMAGEVELSVHLLREVQELARNIENISSREEVLMGLAQTLIMAGEYEAAQELARNIEDSSIRADILRGVVEAMVKAGEYEAAQELTHQIKDSDSRVGVLIGLAQALSMAGEIELSVHLLREVQELARNIEDSSIREEVLIGLAQTLGTAGEYEAAQELAHQIEDSHWREKALRGVVEAIAKAGEYEAAQELAHQIETTSSRSETLRFIAEEMARAGEYEAAQELAHQIETTSSKNWALIEIAEAMVTTGEVERAIHLLIEAQEIAQNIENFSDRAGVLIGIAEAMVTTDEVERATHLLIEAQEIAQNIESHFNYRKSGILIGIAEAMVKTGEVERAIHLLIEVQELTQNIEDVFGDRYGVLSAIAQTLVRVGKCEAAQEIARNIKDSSSDEARALRGIAEEMARAGEYEAAQEIAQNITDSSSDEARALRGIAEEMARAGEYEAAQELARNIKDSNSRSEALRSIAEEMARAGEYKVAQELAHQIETTSSRNWALIEIVEAMVTTGEVEQAIHLLREVQELARNIENSFWGAKALISIAESLVKTGINDEALWLAQHEWRQVDTREHAIELLPLAYPLLPLKPEIGVALAQSFAWVDGFLKGA